MENWRFIQENPDYMVSDHGRVLSLKGKTKRILQSEINSSTGYERTLIYLKGLYTRHNVHRLVAKAFLPNPHNLPQVNHLDGVRTNNHLSNLEWCDAYGNFMHAVRTGLRPPGLSRTACVVTDDKDRILHRYPSIAALSRGEGLSNSQRNRFIMQLSHPEVVKRPFANYRRLQAHEILNPACITPHA